MDLNFNSFFPTHSFLAVWLSCHRWEEETQLQSRINCGVSSPLSTLACQAISTKSETDSRTRQSSSPWEIVPKAMGSDLVSSKEHHHLYRNPEAGRVPLPRSAAPVPLPTPHPLVPFIQLAVSQQRERKAFLVGVVLKGGMMFKC